MKFRLHAEKEIVLKVRQVFWYCNFLVQKLNGYKYLTNYYSRSLSINFALGLNQTRSLSTFENRRIAEGYLCGGFKPKAAIDECVFPGAFFIAIASQKCL